MTARAFAAEFVGTFALVVATCGVGLFTSAGSGNFVAIGAGLAMIMMGYAIGHVSGAHFNPAVTLGLVAAGRFEAEKSISYIVAQVAGGVAAAAVLSVILSGAIPGGKTAVAAFDAVSNTYGSKGGFNFTAAAITEVVASALFLIVVVGATAKHAPPGIAPIAIGTALMVLYLVALPVTNASLNPARSTAAALFAGGTALTELWLFWVAPILGGVIGGLIGRWLQDE